MDRPSGSWIVDPATGELTPNFADETMRARYGPAPDGEPPEGASAEQDDSSTNTTEEVTTDV